MTPTTYTEWPCEAFERPFYREEVIGELYRYLVPKTKLGRGQVTAGERAMREAARPFMVGDTLKQLRDLRRQELYLQVEGVGALLAEAVKKDEKVTYTNILANIKAQIANLPLEGSEATEEELTTYANQHRAEDAIFSAWIGALYIPFEDAPPISKMYRYIPTYLLMETQDFFRESTVAPDEKSSGTTESSENENGTTPKAQA